MEIGWLHAHRCVELINARLFIEVGAQVPANWHFEGMGQYGKMEQWEVGERRVDMMLMDGGESPAHLQQHFNHEE